MTEPEPDAPSWRARNNGTSSRKWFVSHDDGRYYNDRRGILVRFLYHDSARRKADHLNRKDATCPPTPTP